MMRSGAIVLALAGCLGSLATPSACADEAGAPADLREIEKSIDSSLKANGVVGASVVIVDRTGVVWARGFGHADREAGREATADTPFRAGSIAKSVTGLVAMRLAEAGVIDLQTPLREIAPEIAFTNRWEDESPVRLVHLLEHTTGWDDSHVSEYRDFGPDAAVAEWQAFNPRSRTSRWPPGLYMSYSNSGPAVMGYVLEKVSGRSFEELAREHVFDPLGADSATFAQDEATIARTSRSYGRNGKARSFTRIAMKPSGSLIISARDLGRLVHLYVRSGESGGIRILSEAAIDRIETPAASLPAKTGLKYGYGLGNVAAYSNDTLYHGHNGAIDAFIASYAYQKDLGAGFAVMLNTASGTAHGDLRDLLRGYIVSHYGPVDRKSPAPRSTESLKGVSGYFRQHTPRNEFVRIFTDTFDFIRVEREDRSLRFVEGLSGEETVLLHAGNGHLVKEGRPVPHRAVFRGPDGSFRIFTGFNST